LITLVKVFVLISLVLLSGCSFEDESSPSSEVLDPNTSFDDSTDDNIFDDNTTADNNITIPVDTTSPIFTSQNTISINENEINVISITTDEDASFSLSGIDSALFDLLGSNLNFKVAPDFEVDSHSYTVVVTATDTASNESNQTISISIIDVYEVAKIEIPTVVIIMNWDNYSENDPSIWYDKIFNKETNSVNRYYDETTGGEIEFKPISETSGTINDGVVTVAMGKNHPGGTDDPNDSSFRDTEIKNAIISNDVNSNVDFDSFDIDGDGNVTYKELQIIFIVAGGEYSYSDPIDHSIWAHAWSFDSLSAPVVDGVNVMRYSGDTNTSGGYSRFGANHSTHKATIGIIAHELGHAAFNLGDYYDNGGGSGLGSYDLMSGGSWSSAVSDTYDGDTPTQYSAYNRIDAGLDVSLVDVNSSNDITIKCSSRELIKLLTSKTNEYFLIECRDTAKANSDIAFNYDDNTFTEDRLFMMMYHVDVDKADNIEDGAQTSGNHYKVALVEKDSTTLLTTAENIRSNFIDVYTLGNLINTTQTQLYDNTDTNYSVEVLAEDYVNRKMTIRIVK